MRRQYTNAVRQLRRPVAFSAELITSPLCSRCNRRYNSTTFTSSKATSNPAQTIFSGIQPTGVPHLGNYLGALLQWVNLQNTVPPATKLLFSIVDLHAITLPQKPGELLAWKRETMATLLAIGLRPDKSILFYQSAVSAKLDSFEMLLGVRGLNGEGRKDTNSRDLQADRMSIGRSAFGVNVDIELYGIHGIFITDDTVEGGYILLVNHEKLMFGQSKLAMKDDASPLEENIKSKLKLGLFSYPVLQAADILVHRATHVPVGEDQSQHLEFARECVTNFNSAYGTHLVTPDTILSPAKRVMSLQDPSLKMSKSHTDPKSRILITDRPEEIHRKIMSALTDSTNSVSYDPIGRPGVSNLLQLLSHFDSQRRTPIELANLHGDLNLGKFKALVSETISEALAPIRSKYEEVMREDGGAYLDDVARTGGERARESADETMVIVREAVGL